MRSLLARAIPAAILSMLLLPSLVSAHPLGNFTINHYAQVTLDREAIRVRWILDMAEIPAFEEMRGMDADGDRVPNAAEQAEWLDANVPLLAKDLSLAVDGEQVPVEVETRTLSFPEGQGGLRTLRLEVDLRTTEAIRGSSGTFEDSTYPGRIGWREVVVTGGAGIRVTASDVPSAGQSDELRSYPSNAATDPLDTRSASFRFVADASAVAKPAGTDAFSTRAGPSRADDPLATLVGTDLTPLSAMLAVLLAIGLGAIHGISPGHGKTLVAGYLIGSRGTMRQAIWLGATVAISHTVGVFVLGAVTLAATALILPERVIQWLTLGSALLVIGLGASLLRSQRLGRRAHLHGHGHDHVHAHPHGHQHGAADAHRHDEARWPATPPLSTRGLTALGLVGGMVPSASALLVLLVAVALQRIVFGVILVVAFGLGMAIVLTGISASVVVVRGRAASSHAWLRRPGLARLGATLPTASAVLVVAIGLVLTIGAVASLTA
jgi:nickel/cobalt exporter